MFTVDELAFLNKQEAEGKISLHHEPFPYFGQYSIEVPDNIPFTMLEPHHNTQPDFVYTQPHPDTTTLPKPPIPPQNITTEPNPNIIEPHNMPNHRDQHSQLPDQKSTS
jgi:hypothetical protein